MKNFLLLTTLAAAISTASAQETTVNTGGLEFTLDNENNTAMLVAHYYCSSFDDNGYYGDVTVPAYVTANSKQYPVTSIQTLGFYLCFINSVSLPETLVSIGAECFYGEKYLTEVVLPNSLETIGGGCFVNCTALQKVTFGSGLKSISGTQGTSAGGNFVGCTALNSVTTLATVPPTIDDKVFPANVKAQVTLTVPAGCLSAYQNAPNWSGFKEYVEAAPAGPVEAAIDGIWYKLSGDEATVIAAPATETQYAGNLTIPSTVNYEGKAYTVTTLGESCFADNTNITNVDMPATLTTIEDNAFNGTNIGIIYIPDAVTSVGRSFQDCSVFHLALGKGITSIPSNFAAASTRLRYISSPNEVPPTLNAGAFDMSILSRTELFIPVNSESAYKAANNWKSFLPYNFYETTVATQIATVPEEINGEPGTTQALTIQDPTQDASFNRTAYYDYCNIFYTSSDPSVATVDETGNVTLVAVGNANISVSYASILTPLMTPVTTICPVTVSVNTGIDGINADTAVRYFNLQGQPVATPEKGQILIEVGAKSTRKVIF